MNSRSMFAVAAALSSLAEAALSETGAHQGHIAAGRDHITVHTTSTTEYMAVVAINLAQGTATTESYTSDVKSTTMATAITSSVNAVIAGKFTFACTLNCDTPGNSQATVDINRYPVFTASATLTTAEATAFQNGYPPSADATSSSGWGSASGGFSVNNGNVDTMFDTINTALGSISVPVLVVGAMANIYLVHPESSSEQCTSWQAKLPLSFAGSGTDAVPQPTATQLTAAQLGVTTFFAFGIFQEVTATAYKFPSLATSGGTGMINVSETSTCSLAANSNDTATAYCYQTFRGCSFDDYLLVRSIRQKVLKTQTADPVSPALFPAQGCTSGGCYRADLALKLDSSSGNNGQIDDMMNIAQNGASNGFDFTQDASASVAQTRFGLPIGTYNPIAGSNNCRRVLIRFTEGGVSPAGVAVYTATNTVGGPDLMAQGISEFLRKFSGMPENSPLATNLGLTNTMVATSITPTCESGTSAGQCTNQLNTAAPATGGAIWNTTICPPGSGVGTANNFVNTVVFGSGDQINAAYTSLAQEINLAFTNQQLASPGLAVGSVNQIIMYNVAGNSSTNGVITASTTKYITVKQITRSVMETIFFNADWYFINPTVSIMYTGGGSQQYDTTAIISRNSFTLGGHQFAAGTALEFFQSFNTSTGDLIAQAGFAAGLLQLMREDQGCATLFNCDSRSRGSGALGNAIRSLQTASLSNGNNALTFTNGTAASGGAQTSCFSGDTVVATEHGSVPMSQLSVGDVVRTAGGLQPVLSFIHHGVDSLMKFVQIIHEQGLVELSDNHMLHLVDGRDVPARDIRVGDQLVGADGAASLVSEIATVEKSSWMAPLTESGTVMAGGAAASVYVQENGTSHWVAHFGFAPVRFLSSVFSLVERAADFPKAVVKPFVMS